VTRFNAPWGKEVIVMSVLGTLVIALPIALQAWRGFWVVPVMMMTILSIVTLQCVRGYEVNAGQLHIRRLFWVTPWPLDGSTTVTVRPHAMRGAWRIWGNGGLFAITGRFSGSSLGRFHAFVTDPARTVVVSTSLGVVVVSPDRPEAFADAVTEAAGRAA
jgi:hypothetical protein